MSAWDANDRIIAGVADSIVSSFTLNLENDVTFIGLTATGFESSTRAGEIVANADFSIVYDSNTKGLFETMNGQSTGSSTGATFMNNDDTLSNGAFGFKMASSVITDVSFSDGSLMMMNISVKAIGAGIGSATPLVEVGT